MKKIIKMFNNTLKYFYSFLSDFVNFHKLHSKNEMIFVRLMSRNFYNFYFMFFMKYFSNYILLFNIFFVISFLILTVCYLNDSISWIMMYISLNTIIIVTVLIFYICFICFVHQVIMILIRCLYLYQLLYTVKGCKNLCMLAILYFIRIFFKFFFSFHFLLLIWYPVGLDLCYIYLSIVPLFKWIYFNLYIYFADLTYVMLRVPSLSRFIFDPLIFHLSFIIKKLQYTTLNYEIMLLDQYRKNLWNRVQFKISKKNK